MNYKAISLVSSWIQHSERKLTARQQEYALCQGFPTSWLLYLVSGCDSCPSCTLMSLSSGTSQLWDVTVAQKSLLSSQHFTAFLRSKEVFFSLHLFIFRGNFIFFFSQNCTVYKGNSKFRSLIMEKYLLKNAVQAPFHCFLPVAQLGCDVLIQSYKVFQREEHDYFPYCLFVIVHSLIYIKF